MVEVNSDSSEEEKGDIEGVFEEVMMTSPQFGDSDEEEINPYDLHDFSDDEFDVNERATDSTFLQTNMMDS